MPFLSLLGRVPARWWLYLAAIAAVGFLLWREHHATHRANVEHAARLQAEASLAAAQETIAETERRIKADQANRAQLASDLAASEAKFSDLQSHPPKSSVKYVQLPGESCPSLRIDPDWLRSYNAASQAAAVPDSR